MQLKRFCALLTTTLLLLPMQLKADVEELQQASQALCEKMRQCTLAQMQQEEGLTPQMHQMVEGMVANMCSQFLTAEQVVPYTDLVEPATECLQSMAELPCPAFEDDPQTAACQAFEKVAKKYDIER